MFSVEETNTNAADCLLTPKGFEFTCSTLCSATVEVNCDGDFGTCRSGSSRGLTQQLSLSPNDDSESAEGSAVSLSCLLACRKVCNAGNGMLPARC